MRRLFLWTLILCGFLPGLAGARELDLSALSKKIQEDIRKQFPNIGDGTFTGMDLDRMIRYLILQEQFDKASVNKTLSNGTEIYVLSVGKTKRITSIKFTGNRNASETDLRAEITIAEKAQYDEQLVLESLDRIRTFYRDRGYPNAVANLEVQHLSPSEVSLKISVNEGAQMLIKKISLVGENSDLRELTEKTLRRHKGEPYTEITLSEMRKSTRDAFNKKAYFKAELQGPKVEIDSTQSQVNLTYVLENEQDYEVLFEGNKVLSDSDLESALDLENFYSSNPNTAGEIATKTKNYYLSKGFARVELRSEELAGRKDFQRLIRLDIDEGPRVKIEKIEVLGRITQSSEYYEKFIREHSSELIDDGYYNREDIELGVKNLIIDRQNQGFLKAKIISSRSMYNSKKDRITISVNLDEGPLTILDAIEFEGNQSLSGDELKRVMGLDSNQPLRLNKLEEGLAKLKDHYRSNGFIEMALQNEKENLVLYSEENTKARLKIKIYEGPKVTVAAILIEGNTLTKDFVVLKELEFKEGDILTPAKMDESISRLQRLGHFSSVDIKTLEEKSSVANRTVVVKVVDRDPGLFNFGIGVNNENDFTVRGYTGIAYRNIGGTGRGLSARLESNYNVTKIQYPESRATLGYLEPYLFNTRIRGRATITRAKSVQNVETQRAQEVNQYSYSIEQDITSHVLVVYEVLGIATIQDFNYKALECPTCTSLDIGTTGPTVDIDFRDHPFNPTRGTFTRFNLEYSSPKLFSSRTIEYVRTLASFTHYMPIRKSRWVWANSIRGGFLRNLSTLDEGGVPYDKKGITLGGQSSIRGFQPDEAFPNKYEFKDEAGNLVDPENYKLKESATMYLLKSEIRFPISGNLGGAVFYDGGSVTIKGLNIEDPYRDSFGFAARYVTPVGAASLEVGFKLDRKTARRESLANFHLAIGTF